MIRFLRFFLSLLIGLLSAQVFAVEKEPAFRFLKDPQVKWENELLTGELNDVPLKGLLEELSQKQGFQLEVFGDLSETVDVSFDHLTLEQSIKKIMRATGLSYVMIMEGGGSPEKESLYRLKKLIVCRKDKKSQASETYRPRPSRQMQGVEKRPPIDEQEEDLSPHLEPFRERGEPKKEVTKTSKIEFEGAPEDLREYVDELSSEGRISPEEYEMILEKIEQRK